MKMDVVFILGPSEHFHKLNTPKFTLPFLNVPLLKLSMNYLKPFASKVFVVCLEEHKAIALTLLKEYKVPIEAVTTSSYEGMAHVLNVLHKKITSKFFIMTKGDIYGQEPLRSIIEGFLLTNDDVYITVGRSNKTCPVLTIGPHNRLMGIENMDIPFVKNSKLQVTTEYVMKDFFIIRTSCIGQLNEKLYCFKTNIIPYLIKKDYIIRIGENVIFQVLDFNDYVKQLDFKNKILGSSEIAGYNLIGDGCEIENKVTIENSIIGTNVKIGSNIVIYKSIIMDGARVVGDRKYEKCIVDAKNNVYKF